jgi:hypothetical protein
MSHKVNRDKSFLLEWIILHGDNWVWHGDIDMGSYRMDICRKEKYIEEEDQFPGDINDQSRWGSYFRLTKKGRKYATL